MRINWEGVQYVLIRHKLDYKNGTIYLSMNGNVEDRLKLYTPSNPDVTVRNKQTKPPDILDKNWPYYNKVVVHSSNMKDNYNPQY